MTSLIESYSAIVASYEVKRYRQYGGAYEFVAVIEFIDGSSLSIRDYLFIDGRRKYSFHWQNADQLLIRRWDNAKHHKQIATFPFHQHTPEGIEESAPMTLAKVLDYIRHQLQPV
jgi:hypothetical protein